MPALLTPNTLPLSEINERGTKSLLNAMRDRIAYLESQHTELLAALKDIAAPIECGCGNGGGNPVCHKNYETQLANVEALQDIASAAIAKASPESLLTSNASVEPQPGRSK